MEERGAGREFIADSRAPSEPSLIGLGKAEVEVTETTSSFARGEDSEVGRTIDLIERSDVGVLDRRLLDEGDPMI